MKDVLEKRGVISEVRAKLRSEVYKSLDDDKVSGSYQNEVWPIVKVA